MNEEYIANFTHIKKEKKRKEKTMYCVIPFVLNFQKSQIHRNRK